MTVKNGRPPKYKKEFCEKLIDHMAKGLSFESFAGEIGVTFKTLFNWAARYPKFLQSKDLGTAKSIKWWETVGNAAAQGSIPNFKGTSWVFNMKNRFGWRNNLEITGKDGAPLNVGPTQADIVAAIKALTEKKSEPEDGFE